MKRLLPALAAACLLGSTVQAGGPSSTYALTVTNRGAVDSAGVVLRMRVPEGLYGTAGCR